MNFQFETEACSLSVFPYRARLWWRRVYGLWPYSGLIRPERKGRWLAQMPMFVASQTLVVYAPYAQRLNVECSSSLCSQMQSGGLLLMYGCRTDVFRRYVNSGVCWSPHQLHWSTLVNHLSSDSSTVSMTILVVLSMLSLPCGVDDRWSCRRRLGLP